MYRDLISVGVIASLVDKMQVFILLTNIQVVLYTYKMKNLSKIAFFNAHTRQAVVNWYYLPKAKSIRESGISFKSSEFDAPLFESFQDIEDFRMKEFQGQYKAGDNCVYAWDKLDTRPVNRKAEAILEFDLDKSEWATLVYNKEDDAKTIFRMIDEFRPLFLIQCLEGLAQNVSGGMDMEFHAGRTGDNYPHDHIMNLLWRLEGGPHGERREMVSREAHCLIYGHDASPNWNSNRSDGSVRKPNQYHHVNADPVL